MICISNKENLDNKYKAILSTDENDLYYFYAPITCVYWQLMGYQPLVIIVGNPQHWESGDKKVAFEYILKSGGDVVFVNERLMDKKLEGYNLSALAQMSRMCSAYIPFYDDDDYCLTGDIDMLPLNKDWFHQQDFSKKLNIFFSNAYNYTRFAMCYVGGTKDVWNSVINLNAKNMYEAFYKMCAEGLSRRASDKDQWNYDERFLFKKITSWKFYDEDCDMLQREQYPNKSSLTGTPGVPDELPQGRLDRSYWNFSGDISGLIDAHMIRPGYTNKNWAKIYPLFESTLNDELLNFVEEYRNKFKDNK